MKNILFVFVTTLLLSTNLAGQEADEAQDPRKVTKAVPNTSYREIFIQHPELSSMSVELNGDTAAFITMILNRETGIADNEQDKEYYDLGFEGDRYMFQKKFGPPPHNFPEKDIRQFNDLLSKTERNRLHAVLHKDSILYKLSYPVGMFINAAFKGGNDKLKEALMENYQKGKYKTNGDSILIIQGIVDRDGTLKDIALTMGTQSPFSNFVLEWLSGTEQSWLPMIKDGRVYRSLVDVYVRMHSDGSITVSANGRARKLRTTDSAGGALLVHY